MANLSNINNKFIVTDEGKVGIGITAPTGILHTDQTFSGYAPVTFKNSVTNQGQFVELITSTDEGSKYTGIESKSLQTGNGWKIWGGGNNFGEMYLSVSGAHAIVIKNDLKVGIGTASPSVLLDARLSGTTGKVAEFHNSVGYGIGFTVESDGGVNTINSESNQALAFATNGASNERIRITSGGNVGIGTFSPGSRLTVNKTKSGTGVENYDLIRLGLLGTGAVGDSSTIGWFSTSGTKTAGIEGISGLDNILYGELAFHVRRYTTDSYDRVMTINNRGNVGIGTTSPAARLHVVSSTPDAAIFDTTSAVYGAMNTFKAQGVIKGAAGYNSGSMYFGGEAGTNTIIQSGGQTGIYINNSSRNVGIGTTSPSTQLHIDQTSNDRAGGLYIERNGSSYGLSAFVNSGGYGVIGSNGSFTTDILTMNLSNGNVGIGTTTPDNILHLKSNNPKLIFEDGNAGTNEKVYAIYPAGSQYVLETQTDAYGTGQNAYIVDRTGTAVDSHKWYTANTERMRIDTTKMQLTTGASNKAVIQMSSDSAYQIRGGGNYGYISLVAPVLRFDTDGSERMRITSGGNVYVGTSSPAYSSAKIVSEFNGVINNGILVSDTSSTGVQNMLVFAKNGSEVGTITSSTSATNYNTSSDYRLKENVEKMTGALDRVSQLKPSRFNFIADADKTVDGFLAHEVQQIVPEAITGEKDAVDEEGNPEYQGIDQSKLVPLLVGAIKELKAEIELLKNK